MKTVDVVAAIIVKDGKILSTQRGYGDYKGGWEFPGGKIELGETPEVALTREIKEELDLDIKVDYFYKQVEYDYLNFHLSMLAYLCTLNDGELMLKEHSAYKWLSKNELDSVEWLDADKEIVEKLKNEDF